MKKFSICIAMIVVLFACSKTESTFPLEEGTNPASTLKKGNPGGGGGGGGIIVTTTKAFENSAIQSWLRGNLSGGNNSMDRGFCFDTDNGPTIDDATIMAGSGNGDFGATITGLIPGTTYYVKAFAIKNSTVYYGNELSFTTLTLGLPTVGVGPVEDIDGNVYNTITLGTQVWMVENLKTTHYRDGTPIPEVTDNTAWYTITSGAYCNYNNDISNVDVYGRLYNKHTVMDVHNIAPTGWHVPSTEELLTLFNYVGGLEVAGGRMKESGYANWLTPNSGADNSSGFTAVGSGFRTLAGGFSQLQMVTFFWNTSATFVQSYLTYDSGSFTMNSYGCNDCWNYGYSVRCLKD